MLQIKSKNVPFDTCQNAIIPLFNFKSAGYNGYNYYWLDMKKKYKSKIK